jgi:predicted anti-sigma-YlaC factor YlaD
VSSETDSGGMACNELVEVVSDYIEGRLSPADARRFDSHLEICEGCRNYLDQMRETIGALGHLPEESIPPEARAELLEAFRGWTAGR